MLEGICSYFKGLRPGRSSALIDRPETTVVRDWSLPLSIRDQFTPAQKLL
jgi:hypothetical protein